MLSKILCSAMAALTVISAMAFADDTELYLINTSTVSGKRPQILFIFDNSGSMSTEDENVTSSYCSPESNTAGECTYPDGFEEYAAGYSGYINDKGTYWNAGGIDNTTLAPIPDDPTESRRFYDDNNNCSAAAALLLTKGRYTGFLREFKSSGNTGTWSPLAENEGFNQNQVVDCYQDIIDNNADNPGRKKQGNTYTDYPDGFPVNTTDMYDAAIDTDMKNLFASGSPVTLYTAHYLVWYEWVTQTEEGQNSGSSGTRLDAAKAALANALEGLSDSSTAIDAGLAVFNLNYPEENFADGGRIVFDLQEMNETNQSSLISLINGMPAQTNTPLCETLYEAYQYFSGGALTFGDDDANPNGKDKIDDYVINSPASILNTGNYTTPFKKCADTAYIVYITDGAPTLDHSADTFIQSLTGSAKNSGDYTNFTYSNEVGDDETSYLPALASYMANNDLVEGVTDVNGVDHKQNVRLFTIGFSDGADAAAALLEEAAFRAGSPRVNGVSKGYFRAYNDVELAAAINEVLKSIFSIDSSFTSPSIASNNFDKTQTYNSAYFSMFLPGQGPRWSGNLKKLKVNSAGEIVGPGGTATAIDSNGNISASTCTYWNTCSASSIDGNKVNSGGVLPHIRSSLTNRNILTLNSGSLIDIDSSSFASSNAEDLQWLYGVDIDDDDSDGSTTEAREDVMGDPLHSKPLAINFGDKPNENGTESLDVRILVGTNQGLVHMFKDSDTGSDDFTVGSVSETWAFIPDELLGNVSILRQNNPTGSHDVYGMDLSPIVYTETDSDGKVDKAWLYMGMRRGGSSYYALDITDPDSPAFKWKIDSDTTGFEDLGQTWSEPIVTFIPGIDTPVLIFGGGMASSDGSGEVVYIADADTGAFIQKFTSTGMGSVPNKIATLDSNNDGITDRLYATDNIGNVWRIDIPSVTKTTWSIFKFAAISASAAPNNRMFFAEPTVAQTQFNNIDDNGTTISYQVVPYDAVTVGSGNRTNPLGTTTDDMFYVFQDRNVVTKTFTSADAPAPLTVADLYNVTSAAPSSQSDNIAFGGKRGWYYNFQSTGEKSLSASLIFDGKVYFTSFVPPINQDIDLDAGVCGFSGEGRLYVFDLHKGTRTYSEPYFEIGERVPDTPQIVIPKPEDGEEAEAYIIGVGKGECENGECKGTVALGSGLSTNRIYYHINE
ncbi:PilC/PilY family type IV pilus protein [Shewanella sp. Isolate11]|uniref:pilus assembly protein n=1 Tax=Shewanella sp. Isolate11 TaxID=2908530 RepID=UPI001EFC63E5|nr:PilC/PilY family type IV pilus protein [Shewanella sp. Isolate11]MCG9695993.1 type IV pilin biogenesis protein [Shewanella sp. Isolate11]